MFLGEILHIIIIKLLVILPAPFLVKVVGESRKTGSQGLRDLGSYGHSMNDEAVSYALDRAKLVNAGIRGIYDTEAPSPNSKAIVEETIRVTLILFKPGRVFRVLIFAPSLLIFYAHTPPRPFLIQRSIWIC